MTAAEVQHVLGLVQSNYGTALSDIPLERVDGDNSDLLDDTPLHQVSPELAEMNYLEASSGTISRTPIGTEADFDIDTVVSCRLIGAHVSKHGAIDPQAGTNNAASVSWPTVQWDTLKWNVVGAIDDGLEFPSPGRSNVGYTHAVITEVQDPSSNYGDAYVAEWDVLFDGFETR